MMFARLDFPRFLVCCFGDLSDNESDEKPSVAICGGSICILTGLLTCCSFLGNRKLEHVNCDVYTMIHIAVSNKKTWEM